MEAERQKRAEITLALANKESRINLSEGEKQEAINLSEGEKQKRINEAVGKAKEIQLIANATAQGIKRVASAIKKPGGKQAIGMRIAEQFIDELGMILSNAKVTIAPLEIATLRGVLDGLTQKASVPQEPSLTRTSSPPPFPSATEPRLPGTRAVK